MLFFRDDVIRFTKESPTNSIKLMILKNGGVKSTGLFTNDWALFNFLDELKPDNSFDTIIVSSRSKPQFSDMELFMDGRLLQAFCIVVHDDEKIPATIDAYYKYSDKLKTITAPFFLFCEPEITEKSNDKINAFAFFSQNDLPSDIAENTKLAQDAGYCLCHRIVLNKSKTGRCVNQIVGNIKEIEDIEAILIFFKTSSSEIAEIEKETGLEILSRDDLIISIFNDRASGTSGKLKLAGAVIAKEKSQFRKKIGGLSRIKGGIGLKGPGETKEEERKRILKKKEKNVRQDLKSEFERISFQMNYRKKSTIKTVAVVGYTNAGKSTIFNSIINETVSRESNSFFSSIDPKIKKFSLFGKPLFLVDTVGFISDMTSDITDAFKSTLLEIANADMILHIIDSTSKGWEGRKKFIEETLIKNGSEKEKIFPLFSKSDKIRIKHPVKNGFFYNSFDLRDILKVKRFIYDFLFSENEPIC